MLVSGAADIATNVSTLNNQCFVTITMRKRQVTVGPFNDHRTPPYPIKSCHIVAITMRSNQANQRYI